MRRCGHEGCGHKLHAGNVSGLCLVHYNEARLTKAIPVRICSACQRNALCDGNRSGLCLACYNAMRAARVPECSDCGAKISHANKSGRCASCYYRSMASAAPMCAHEGCDARLKPGSKSGLCRSHKHAVRKPVPNDATVELARGVAEALGVDHREIFGRDQSGEIVEARAVVASALRARGLSWNRIGLRLGRDHSSVMNIVRRLPVYAQRNPLVAQLLERAA